MNNNPHVCLDRKSPYVRISIVKLALILNVYTFAFLFLSSYRTLSRPRVAPIESSLKRPDVPVDPTWSHGSIRLEAIALRLEAIAIGLKA